MLGLVFITAVFFSVYLIAQSLSASLSQIKTESEKSRFFRNLGVVKFQPYVLPYEQEIETALLRACQLGQSWILRCQECFIETRDTSACPYPTESFCRSALGANINDWGLLWGFLPNPSGNLSEIWTAPEKDPSTLTDISEIPLGIRYIIRRTYPLRDWSGFRYERPEARPSGFPCGVSGVVTR